MKTQQKKISWGYISSHAYREIPIINFSQRGMVAQPVMLSALEAETGRARVHGYLWQ